jgi:DNA-directed RNA polymerase specialized sigma24 family protein
VWVRVHNRDAVDDLVQDMLADALARFATADDVVAWLLRLAAYACNRHLWDQPRPLLGRI